MADPRLLPVNAVLALHLGGGTWPRALADAGHAVHQLEFPVGDVVVDVVSFAHAQEHVVLFECKSGANVEPVQAKGYASISIGDIRRVMTMPATATHGVAYVCLEEHEARIRMGLPAGAGLLVVGPTRVRLEPGSTRLPSLDLVVSGPPPTIIALDHESPVAEYRDPVVAQLAAAAARGEQLVSTRSLAERITVQYRSYGRSAREAMRKRAEEALRVLLGANGDLSAYFRIEKGEQHDGLVVRVLKTPLLADPRGATQQWQAMQRAARGGRRKKPTVPQGQLDLWALAKDLEPEEGEE